MGNLDQISRDALSDGVGWGGVGGVGGGEGEGRAALDFGADRIGILVSMATYSSHTLIMAKT